MQKIMLAAGLGCAFLCIATSSSRASITLLAGPQQGTHVGNLVVNGSFETGASAAGAPSSPACC